MNFNDDFITYKCIKNEIDSIIFELKNNKVAIIQTDTVPGIISLSKKQIYKVKKRPLNKKLINFISNINQVPNYNEKFKVLAEEFWPGNLTLIYKGISYRMPNNKYILKIIDDVGPLYSSSANISGEQPIRSKYEAFIHFKKYKNDIIFIEGDYSIHKQPSTIFDVDKNKVIREGEIKYESIKQFLK